MTYSIWWRHCHILMVCISASSSTLPNILQQANIQVLTTAQCTSQMTGVSGVQIWDNHICLRDAANNIGSCNVCFSTNYSVRLQTEGICHITHICLTYRNQTFIVEIWLSLRILRPLFIYYRHLFRPKLAILQHVVYALSEAQVNLLADWM
jgi:hypothetical protein